MTDSSPAAREPVLYTETSANRMAAILASGGAGEIRFRDKWPFFAGEDGWLQRSGLLLLVGHERSPRGVEWAAIVDGHASAKANTAVVREAIALAEALPASHLLLKFDAKPPKIPLTSEFEDCTVPLDDAVAIRRLMARRSQARAAADELGRATVEDWKQALLRAQRQLTERQRTMLSLHAQANRFTTGMTDLARAVGLKTFTGAMREYEKAGRILAKQLGAKGLFDFLDVLSTASTAPDPDDLGLRTLRVSLGRALRELGWEALTPDVPQRDEVDDLVLEAAAKELESDGSLDGASVTVREALVMARVGQGAYRSAVMEVWGARCALTGAGTPEVLIASHILPWAQASNEQRLDPFNGLLLAASVDRLFDKGLISFTDEGELLKSASLTDADLETLGVKRAARLRFVKPAHRGYLEGHRAAFGFDD